MVTQCLIWDVGERKRAEAELRKYQERLRTLALELSLVQERERRRIAIDLHDQIGQNLAISKMKLEAVREASRDANIQEPLNEVYSLIMQTIQDTRSLVFELSPPFCTSWASRRELNGSRRAFRTNTVSWSNAPMTGR